MYEGDIRAADTLFTSNSATHLLLKHINHGYPKIGKYETRFVEGCGAIIKIPGANTRDFQLETPEIPEVDNKIHPNLEIAELGDRIDFLQVDVDEFDERYFVRFVFHDFRCAGN